jgi:malate dehydrogenase (oxaloacetate-decarboxylating)(NADP+)
VKRGDADAMLCGLEARFDASAKILRDIIGLAPGVREYSAMSLVLTQRGAYFLADTHVRSDPTAEEIADMTAHCAEHVRRFGLDPKIALLSHSDFGSADTPSAKKMRQALSLIRARHPELHIDGEMAADTALVQAIRDQILPSSSFEGEANVLVMPNLDAANIAFQLIKVVADALPVGPILIGPAYPAHILTPSVTARGIVNMTAIAVAESQAMVR